MVDFQNGQVTFSYYDNWDQGTLKSRTVSAVDFIGLFLMHVLPRCFVRIRYFDLYHGSCRGKSQQARRLLGLPFELPVKLKLKLIDWLMLILDTDEDPLFYPDCREGLMIPLRDFGTIQKWLLQFLSILGLCTRWKTGFAH